MLIRVEKDYNQKQELKTRLLQVLDEFLGVVRSASLTQRDGCLYFSRDIGRTRIPALVVLVVARHRVQERKRAGKSANEIAASKPLADLETTWSEDFFNSDVFARIVYSAL